MERLVHFQFRDHFRATLNGVAVKCKHCDRVTEFDLVAGEHKERRHRCNVSDHPATPDGPQTVSEFLEEDFDWDDELDPEGIEDEVGARIARGFDLRGYGEMNEAYTAFSERW